MRSHTNSCAIKISISVKQIFMVSLSYAFEFCFEIISKLQNRLKMKQSQTNRKLHFFPFHVTKQNQNPQHTSEILIFISRDQLPITLRQNNARLNNITNNLVLLHTQWETMVWSVKSQVGKLPNSLGMKKEEGCIKVNAWWVSLFAADREILFVETLHCWDSKREYALNFASLC